MVMIQSSISPVEFDRATVEAICSTPDFRITTSLRWPDASSKADGSDTDTLKLHQARLLASAKTLNFTHVANTLSGDTGRIWLLNAIEEHARTTLDADSSYKLTLSVSRDACIAVTSAPISGPLYDFAIPGPTSTGPEARVYLGSEPTTASPFTMHKTSHRSMYARARAAAGIEHESPTSAEVLLYNHKKEVMEASVSTIYFHRNGQWVTPASSCGGNLGSTRSLALDRGWCIEGTVMLHDIADQEIVVLSNGVRGFWLAHIRSSGS